MPIDKNEDPNMQRFCGESDAKTPRVIMNLLIHQRHTFLKDKRLHELHCRHCWSVGLAREAMERQVRFFSVLENASTRNAYIF